MDFTFTTEGDWLRVHLTLHDCHGFPGPFANGPGQCPGPGSHGSLVMKERSRWSDRAASTIVAAAASRMPCAGPLLPSACRRNPPERRSEHLNCHHRSNEDRERGGESCRGLVHFDARETKGCGSHTGGDGALPAQLSSQRGRYGNTRRDTLL